jgi:nucleoside-diphosphate-sugar epimerase
LSEELLRRGHEVVAIDAFIPYYPRAVKEANLAICRASSDFRLWEYDLRDGLPADVLDGVECVFHLAAVPGLSRSWTEYGLY